MILYGEQGTEDWYRARMGIPTASEFSTVMAVGRGGGESKTRRTYMLKLAGEILTGEPMENYSNAYMERGKAMEGEAREHYAFINDIEPEQVAFIRHTDVATGCSPDSLVGTDGLLEIKTKLPHLLIDELVRDRFPPEHHAQCMGQIWISGREWCDLAIYWPKLPMLTYRLHRDQEAIAKIADAVDGFNAELAELVDKVRRYGADPTNDDDALRAAGGHYLMAG